MKRLVLAFFLVAAGLYASETYKGEGSFVANGGGSVRAALDGNDVVFTLTCGAQQTGQDSPNAAYAVESNASHVWMGPFIQSESHEYASSRTYRLVGGAGGYYLLYISKGQMSGESGNTGDFVLYHAVVMDNRNIHLHWTNTGDQGQWVAAFNADAPGTGFQTKFVPPGGEYDAYIASPPGDASQYYLATVDVDASFRQGDGFITSHTYSDGARSYDYGVGNTSPITSSQGHGDGSVGPSPPDSSAAPSGGGTGTGTSAKSDVMNPNSVPNPGGTGTGTAAQDALNTNAITKAIDDLAKKITPGGGGGGGGTTDMSGVHARLDAINTNLQKIETKTQMEARQTAAETDATNANSSAATAGSAADTAARNLFQKLGTATSTSHSSSAAPNFAIVFPAAFGGATVDLNPFSAGRFGGVCSWFRAATLWLAVILFGQWFWKEISEWVKGVSTTQQAKGNAVFAGTGGQATGLVAAGLMTGAIAAAIVAILAFSFGGIGSAVVNSSLATNPVIGMASGAFWMLDQVLPVSTLLSLAVAKVTFNMYALPIYSGCSALVRFIVP